VCPFCRLFSGHVRPSQADPPISTRTAEHSSRDLFSSTPALASNLVPSYQFPCLHRVMNHEAATMPPIVRGSCSCTPAYGRLGLMGKTATPRSWKYIRTARPSQMSTLLLVKVSSTRLSPCQYYHSSKDTLLKSS